LCFRRLLTDDTDLVIYLDPDILILKPLDDVFSAIESGKEIALTPHILSPLPDDGRSPENRTLLQTGVYNMGFAAFSNTPRNLQILDWWGQQLRTHCLVDVAAGLFTDQKWVDLFPAFSPAVELIRSPAYNVAYWNLHERTVVFDSNKWIVTFVDGSQRDLVFFHFSGYLPERKKLSVHENRFGDNPSGDINALLSHYTELLAKARHQEFRKRVIREPAFENGLIWDMPCRTLYRKALKTDRAFDDPLAGGAFFAFAAAVEPGDHVPRYVRAVLSLRPDVAREYDDGRNEVGLLRWMLSDGAQQLGITPEMLSQLEIGRPQFTGVNYVGYFRAHLGVGEAARNAVAALRAVDLKVSPHDVTHLASSPVGAYDLDLAASSDRHNVTILGVNADETPRVLSQVSVGHDGGLRIGHWAWETPEFPEQWCDRFNLVDEVWVASEFVAKAVRAKATVPVVVVPYAVSVPKVARDRLWLSKVCPSVGAAEFVFVCFFDVGSLSFRKNPQSAMKAFARAFKPEDPVRLVVKIINGERDPALLKSLADEVGQKRVTIWNASLEPMDRFRLLASADAFVSLHRSEGFGLVIAETMAMGLPVVVTGWSGNTDFTTEENAAIVSYNLIRSDKAYGPYVAGTEWAEADLDHAARQMRRVWEDDEWRRAIGVAAAATIKEKFSPIVVGKTMKARLERLLGSARHARRTSADSERSVASLRSAPSIWSALEIVSRDVLSRPVFYMTRSVRIPRIVAQEGMRNAIIRLSVQSQVRKVGADPEFSIRKIVQRLWVRFTRRWLDDGKRR